MFRLAMIGAVVVLAGVRQVSAEGVPGLVHHWTFDETEGTVAADSVSGNNGTLNNWGPSEPRWVDGKVGGALDFGDTNNYVITDSSILFDRYTIALWLKVHAKEGINPRLVAPSGGRDFPGIVISNWFDRGVGVYYDHGRILAQDPNLPILGSWEHYAVTFDHIAAEAAVYRDGVEVARDSFPSTLAASPWYIGHTASITDHRDSLNGQMDDVRFYDRLLGPGEVAALAAIPEPSTLIMLGVGAMGLLGYGWRKKRRSA